ncbi:hypothetical protein LIER_32991 [Lithospermum erythrorhizon]|uniref:Uncharacterized protein n=1 Tax=Lithospermum erythrorhizon TaxID=34254 RepID=A0AAV3RVH9_LITER
MPFTNRLDAVPLPKGFILPQFTQFNGTCDPIKNLQGFLAKMTITSNDPDIYAKAFSNSLADCALDLVHGPEYQIHRFISTDSGCVHCKVWIRNTKISEVSGLRHNDILLTIPEVNYNVAYMAVYRGLAYGKLKKALVLEARLSKYKLTTWVRQYIELEELKNKKGKTKDLRDTLRNRGRSRSPTKAPVWDRLQFQSEQLTPLRVSIAEVYVHIEGKNLLPKPVRMRNAPGRRDKTRYCEYHREHGHDTNECRILNAEIEKLIKRGYLKEFTGKGTQQDNTSQNRRIPPLPQVKAEPVEVPRLIGRIDTISGAPIIVSFTVERMLVDTGSSVDILYVSTFDKLQLPRSLIQPLHTPLTGFTCHSINAIGVVALDFTVGADTRPPHINRIKSDSVIGSSQNKVTYPGGIGEMCGDQKKARRCYQTSVPPPNRSSSGPERKRSRENHMEINSVKSEVDEDNSPKERESEKRALPHEEVIIVPFTQGNRERTFRIGTKLGKYHQHRLIALIREFEDVFAWGPEDMPAKEKRLFNDEKNTTIREEVQALQKAHAIRELKFPAWVANVVLFKKPNNKWRMCTAFTNLNKACPKDFYPLPCLGRLVDGSAGNEGFDFMDAS